MSLARLANKNFAPAVIVNIIEGFNGKKTGSKWAVMVFSTLMHQWSKRQAIAILKAIVAFLGAFTVAFTKKAVELMKK